MSEKNYLKDISEIKNMMNRSSRFISLSGLSGILAGIYAIIGAVITQLYLMPKHREYLIFDSYHFKIVIALLFSIASLSVLSAILLTLKKAKTNNEQIWDTTTKRLLVNFLIPLLTGGIYIAIKLNSQHYGLTASLMLIFYGLALVNASKYTLGNIKYLGYVEIILGLFCAALPGYGLWFWMFGFGVMHVLYGILMYTQENKKP